MENWTAENFELVGLALLKMAYNFWPILAVIAVYCLWEAVYRPFERGARPKINNAYYRERGKSYSRDCAQQSGRRHL